MKVILLTDVKKIGRAHEEVEVADGFALNSLIPKKLAVAATPAARKEAELRRSQKTQRAEVSAALVAETLAALAEARIVVRAKANEQGHLYDAVAAPEIIAAAKEAHIELPESAIKLEKPIKELGTFEVPVVAGKL